MFNTAKTFSVHRRVHNHYTKRILNLILNRKNFFRRRSEALGRLIRGIQRFHGACPRQFVHPSIRQVRLRIGHKFIDGIGDIIIKPLIHTSILSSPHDGKSSLAVLICWIGGNNCIIQTDVHGIHILRKVKRIGQAQRTKG